jgi:hypothetical protein
VIAVFSASSGYGDSVSKGRQRSVSALCLPVPVEVVRWCGMHGMVACFGAKQGAWGVVHDAGQTKVKTTVAR